MDDATWCDVTGTSGINRLSTKAFRILSKESADQTSEPAMILNTDHTKKVVKSLAQIEFHATGASSDNRPSNAGCHNSQWSNAWVTQIGEPPSRSDHNEPL